MRHDNPTRSIVFHEPGRVAGWPANYGLWAWGEEILAMFSLGWCGQPGATPPRDETRPFYAMQARSLDGGATWRTEPFPGRVPGSGVLSGDEHVIDPLKTGPQVRPDDFVPVGEPVDFADPETLVLCARTSLAAGATSWFYLSRDRGASWSGPHALPSFDLPGVATRTDVVSLGGPQALYFLTVTKTDGAEGRVLVAATADGGATFEPRSYLGPEPDGFLIMSSTQRRPDGSLVSAVRGAGVPAPDGARDHWIDCYRSTDEGRTWHYQSRAVDVTGTGGNPPAMVALPDGRLVIVYGYRAEPYGMRYVVSGDEGASWSEPIILTDDSPTFDMGYPRAVSLDGGDVLAVWYNTAGPDTERFIESVRFRPIGSHVAASPR